MLSDSVFAVISVAGFVLAAAGAVLYAWFVHRMVRYVLVLHAGERETIYLGPMEYGLVRQKEVIVGIKRFFFRLLLMMLACFPCILLTLARWLLPEEMTEESIQLWGIEIARGFFFSAAVCLYFNSLTWAVIHDINHEYTHRSYSSTDLAETALKRVKRNAAGTAIAAAILLVGIGMASALLAPFSGTDIATEILFVVYAVMAALFSFVQWGAAGISGYLPPR